MRSRKFILPMGQPNPKIADGQCEAVRPVLYNPRRMAKSIAEIAAAVTQCSDGSGSSCESLHCVNGRDFH